ncbi:hypothetical protein N9N67_10220 [Bacteriovoracaceae bacterium]|nr:hypothetical protein [Bacteriovoracaceae bacterium]
MQCRLGFLGNRFSEFSQEMNKQDFPGESWKNFEAKVYEQDDCDFLVADLASLPPNFKKKLISDNSKVIVFLDDAQYSNDEVNQHCSNINPYFVIHSNLKQFWWHLRLNLSRIYKIDSTSESVMHKLDSKTITNQTKSSEFILHLSQKLKEQFTNMGAELKDHINTSAYEIFDNIFAHNQQAIDEVDANKVIGDYAIFSDEGNLLIQISDFFGSLSKKDIDRVLFKKAELKVNRKTRGAGIGLHLVWNQTSNFLISLKDGRETRIQLYFYTKSASFKDKNSFGKSFGYFENKRYFDS